MHRPISIAGYEKVLTSIEAIYACRSLEDFPRVVIAALRQVVDCNRIGYNEINLKQQRAVFAVDPLNEMLVGLMEKFPSYMHQHPVIAYSEKTGDGQALKISDFLTTEEFHQLPIYTEIFRHISTEDQLSFSVHVEPGFVIGIAFNRDEASFTEEERQRLNLVRPHIIQAYRYAAEIAGHTEQKQNLQAALRESGIGVITLDASGKVSYSTPGTFECLARYLPIPESPQIQIPSQLEKWLQGKIGGAPLEPLILSREFARLIIRSVESENRHLLLLSEENGRAIQERLDRFALTPREREVLRWVAEGKSNADIAKILELNVGTVKVHVERILTKLGVENRTSAALLVHGVS